MGVQARLATARRQTEAAGAAYEVVQNEQASHLVHEQEKKSKKGRAKSCQPNTRPVKEPETKLILSSDGAMVPLVGGVWAEAKTVVIGEVQSKEHPCKQRPEQQVETVNLSYFSRLTDERNLWQTGDRGFPRAGASHKPKRSVRCKMEPPGGKRFVDLHRPDAVRILDFAHAADSSP